MRTINSNSNGETNGSKQYQPSKTWEHLAGDSWLEEDEEVPGNTKITDSDAVINELEIDDLGEDQ